MGWAAELRTLESHFNTEWAGTTPVQYANDSAFQPPTDGSSWVSFTVIQGGSGTMGGRSNTARLFRHAGVIQIDIFTPQGIGVESALSLADQAAAIFRATRIDDVLCRAPAISRPASDGNYFRVTLSINYQRDEIL